MRTLRILIALTMAAGLVSCSPDHGTVCEVVYDKLSTQQAFGVASLSQALKSAGYSPVLVDRPDATGKEDIYVSKLISDEVIQTEGYVSVKEFGSGSDDFGPRLTPIELATALEHDAGKALTLVNEISTSDETLKCEIEDVEAWSYLGLHFANKLRTAVAINQKEKDKAIKYITLAQQNWVDLVKVTETHIIPGFVYGEKRGGPQGEWHWSAYQSAVDADVEWVKSQRMK